MARTLSVLSLTAHAALAVLLVGFAFGVFGFGHAVRKGESSAPSEMKTSDAIRSDRDPKSEKAESHAAPADAAAHREPLIWGREDVRSVLSRLREMGASPRVLVAVAGALIDDHYTALRNAARYPADMPKWKRLSGGSIQNRERMEVISREWESEMRSFLGPDYDAGVFRPNPGLFVPANLKPEQIAKVAAIVKDYDAIVSMAVRENPGSHAKAELNLENEMMKDLQTVLSPAEAAEYMSLHSSFARELRGRLKGASLDDAQYRAIYESSVQLRNRTLNEYSGVPEWVVHHAVAEMEMLRKTLGDEFVANNTNTSFSQLNRLIPFFRETGIGATQSANRIAEVLRFQIELMSLERTATSREDHAQRIRTAATRTYTALTAGLSEADKDKFDRNPSAQFIVRHIGGQK